MDIQKLTKKLKDHIKKIEKKTDKHTYLYVGNPVLGRIVLDPSKNDLKKHEKACLFQRCPDPIRGVDGLGPWSDDQDEANSAFDTGVKPESAKYDDTIILDFLKSVGLEEKFEQLKENFKFDEQDDISDYYGNYDCYAIRYIEIEKLHELLFSDENKPKI